MARDSGERRATCLEWGDGRSFLQVERWKTNLECVWICLRGDGSKRVPSRLEVFVHAESGATFGQAEVFYRLNSEEMFALAPPRQLRPCLRLSVGVFARPRTRLFPNGARGAASWHRLNRQISPIPDGPQANLLPRALYHRAPVSLAFVSCFHGLRLHRRGSRNCPTATRLSYIQC